MQSDSVCYLKPLREHFTSYVPIVSQGLSTSSQLVSLCHVAHSLFSVFEMTPSYQTISRMCPEPICHKPTNMATTQQLPCPKESPPNQFKGTLSSSSFYPFAWRPHYSRAKWATCLVPLGWAYPCCLATVVVLELPWCRLLGNLRITRGDDRIPSVYQSRILHSGPTPYRKCACSEQRKPANSQLENPKWQPSLSASLAILYLF